MKKMILKFLFLIFFCLTNLAFAQYRPPQNGVVTISSSGTSDRTQLNNLTVSECTLQALSANSGNVYIGGYTVTNLGGSNSGIQLTPGSAISELKIKNLNHIYVSADTANDKIRFFCF